jgi:glycopeptide antibiotics resistance protein
VYVFDAAASIERQDPGPMRGFNVLPWLIPGLILSAILGVLAGRRVGRVFGASPTIGWGLIVGFGLVVSATLTPLRAGLDFDSTGIGTCDLSRIGVAPLRELLRIGDTSLNVLLFIPLGFALGLVPQSRRLVALAVVAVTSPFVIEAAQLVLPILGRGCQSADVFDNLTGLVLGWLIGTGFAILSDRVAPPADFTG